MRQQRRLRKSFPQGKRNPTENPGGGTLRRAWAYSCPRDALRLVEDGSCLAAAVRRRSDGRSEMFRTLTGRAKAAEERQFCLEFGTGNGDVRVWAGTVEFAAWAYQHPSRFAG